MGLTPVVGQVEERGARRVGEKGVEDGRENNNHHYLFYRFMVLLSLVAFRMLCPCH